MQETGASVLSSRSKPGLLILWGLFCSVHQPLALPQIRESHATGMASLRHREETATKSQVKFQVLVTIPESSSWPPVSHHRALICTSFRFAVPIRGELEGWGTAVIGVMGPGWRPEASAGWLHGRWTQFLVNRNLAPSADPAAGDSWSTRLGLQPRGGGWVGSRTKRQLTSQKSSSPL